MFGEGMERTYRRVGQIALLQDADSLPGAIKFTSGEAKMTIQLTGRRIGGCEQPAVTGGER